MMRVRFDTGLVLQYNDACFAERAQSGYTDLYTIKGGAWVAQVPTERCVVEVRPPCRVYTQQGNAVEEQVASVERLTHQVDRLRARNRRLRAELKARGSR